MLQDEVGGTTYTESGSSTFPSSGYTFNSTKSGCMDANGEKIDGALSYDDETHKASVTTNKTSYCYFYFDMLSPSIEDLVLAYPTPEQNIEYAENGEYVIYNKTNGIYYETLSEAYSSCGRTDGYVLPCS